MKLPTPSEVNGAIKKHGSCCKDYDIIVSIAQAYAEGKLVEKEERPSLARTLYNMGKREEEAQ